MKNMSQSNINKHWKYILIFHISSFFLFFCLFWTEQNLTKKQKKIDLYMFRSVTCCWCCCCSLKMIQMFCHIVLCCFFIFYFNIIILIAYVSLVNKRISQFIGWHVCLWHLSTISHSKYIFNISFHQQKNNIHIEEYNKKRDSGYNLHLNARFLVRFFCDIWMQFNDKNVFH